MAAESNEFSACGACGRTILRGEHVVDFVSPDGERVTVCSLCKPAVESAGWIRADLVGAIGRGAPARRRGLGLRERLERASQAARELAARSVRRPVEGDEKHATTAATPPRAPRPRPAPEAPLPPERLMRRAVEHFNATTETRKVAGLIRSLGDPRVAVLSDGAGRALVTVAWELSWYQWEVATGGEKAGVREIRKGNEVSELRENEQAWNARAGADGSLRLEAEAAPTAQASAG